MLPGGEAVLEWTVSPWHDDPRRAALAVIATLLMALLAAWLLRGEPVPGALLGLAVLIALAPGMVPIRCRVDTHGVGRRILGAWERRAWPEIRRARVDVRGLYVSPLAAAGRLDRFRGLFLPVPRGAGAAADLAAALRRELERHGL